VLLNSSLRGGEHTDLFKMTESFRPARKAAKKIDNLLGHAISLLEDLMFLESVRRNWCAIPTFWRTEKLAESADFDWINRARAFWERSSGHERNLLRSLSWMRSPRRWSGRRSWNCVSATFSYARLAGFFTVRALVAPNVHC